MKSAHRSAIYAQGNSLVLSRPLMRPCPKCGAWPGKRCFKVVGIGDGYPGYQEPLLNPHRERRRKNKTKGSS